MYLEECPLCGREVMMEKPLSMTEWVFRVHFPGLDETLCGSSGMSLVDVAAVERMRTEGFRTAAHP